jgi:hypothetical protein
MLIDADIKIHDVAILERSHVGYAMKDDLVDGCTQ